MRNQVFLAVAVVAASTSGVYGGQITVRVEGTVSSIDDPVGVFSTLTVGDKVTGHYSYDVTLPDRDADPLHGNYHESTIVDRLSLNVGSFVFSPVPGDALIIDINDNDPAVHDTFMMQAVVPNLSDCQATGTFLIFRDLSDTAITNDALLRDAPDFGSFPIRRGLVQAFVCGPDSESPIFQFDITSARAVAVPAVSEWGLAIIALSLVGCGAILLRRHGGLRNGM